MISIVLTIPRPTNFRLTSTASVVPSSIDRITDEAVILTVLRTAARNVGSENTSLYSSNQTNLFEPGVSVFQLRRLYHSVTTNGACVTTIM